MTNRPAALLHGYTLTKAGTRQLSQETANLNRIAIAITGGLES